jgi:basic membrane protein A
MESCMLKAVCYVFVLVVAALAFTACSGHDAAPVVQVKVGMAYASGGTGDGSFNDAAYAGLLKAEQIFGCKASEVVQDENETDAGREQILRGLASSGCNPVIAVGYTYGAALEIVAREFPRTTFAIIDSTVAGANIASLVFTAEQGSYLVGVIAASASKTGRIGFIGGMEIDLIKAFEAGYVQGARSVNPDIVTEAVYLGAAGDVTVWDAPDKARSATEEMIAGGVDIVYAAAGASGLGMIRAVNAAGGPDKGLWAIGVDTDQYNEPSLALVRDGILTSMIKRVDVAVYEVIKGVVAGSPLTGVQNFDLLRDGVGYATSNPEVEPYQAAANAAAAQIRSGEITVNPR